VQWSEWVRVEAHDGSGLAYFDEAQKYVEIQGDGGRLLLIDPGVTPSSFRAKSAESKRAEGDPVLVSREQWGCTPATCPVREAPVYTRVTHLVVHHTAGANQAADWPAVVRSIWTLHVRGNGWNDIGYNYLIDPDGVLYEGRAGGDGVLGAHFSAVNTGTMGVSLLGTFSQVAPSEASLATLSRMLTWQAAKWSIDPGGRSLHAASGLMLNHVSGHRDAGLSPRASGTTECPGNGLYALLPSLRTETRQSRFGACLVDVGREHYCVGSEGAPLQVRWAEGESCSREATLPAWVVAEGDGYRVLPNEGARRSATLRLGGRVVDVTQSGKDEPALPCIAFGGIVNAASFDPRPVTAGSIVSIFGENFATEGVNLQINGRDAEVLMATPGQINARMPSTLNTGSARATVAVQGTRGPEVLFWVTESAPAIFLVSSGANEVALYVTNVGNGRGPWKVTINGRDAESRTLEQVPGLAGVWEARVLRPAELSGEAEFVFTQSGVASPALKASLP
jgi:hypothetical protein